VPVHEFMDHSVNTYDAWAPSLLFRAYFGPAGISAKKQKNKKKKKKKTSFCLADALELLDFTPALVKRFCPRMKATG